MCYAMHRPRACLCSAVAFSLLLGPCDGHLQMTFYHIFSANGGSVCLSVRPPVCHTCDARLNG